jgi:hypothetical protein
VQWSIQEANCSPLDETTDAIGVIELSKNLLIRSQAQVSGA